MFATFVIGWNILIPFSLYHWTYVEFRLCAASTNSNQLSGVVSLHLHYTTITIVSLARQEIILELLPIMNIPSDNFFMLYFENTSGSTMLGPVIFYEGSGV